MLTKEDTGFIKGIAVLLLLFHHNPNADWDLLSILYGGYVDEFLLIVFIGTLFRQKKIYERLPSVRKEKDRL